MTISEQNPDNRLTLSQPATKPNGSLQSEGFSLDRRTVTLALFRQAKITELLDAVRHRDWPRAERAEAQYRAAEEIYSILEEGIEITTSNQEPKP